ncbi:hypothetical protein BG844_20150 [Couchioplanes caeruleus subsp. caeruleus]|uniref:Transposase IS4-like domain-containing protein n=1 Tax=Couchioplanes caeruleus subsp. caeruleus TaxID=56427 RepID=A0A1K0GJT0_9ACTN|nr:hypothetical protein BG844_20150 [Couchioplanes caeruleus subsp. caeruleus]
MIDSQSVRGAETVARTSRGYDAGKKVNGRKRHVAVDTCGLLLAVLVTAAHTPDRDGAKPLLWVLHACSPSVRHVWADSDYAGKVVDWATASQAQRQSLRRWSSTPSSSGWVRRPDAERQHWALEPFVVVGRCEALQDFSQDLQRPT